VCSALGMLFLVSGLLLDQTYTFGHSALAVKCDSEHGE
jgi:hypothetical protein